jgi:gliding motility-associated-like protein
MRFYNSRFTPVIIIVFFLFKISSLYSQCNLLCNTDFENLQNSPAVIIVDTSLVPCWGTTASDNKIEVWHTGYNGVPSYSGNQFIELNAFFVSTLFQNFTSTAGTLLTVSFAHRGRVGTDVMSVEVGPVGGPYTTLGTFTDGNTAWGYYTVNYTVPSGVGNLFTLRFNSVSAAGGNPALGNFLDAISVNLPSSINLSFTSTPTSCSGSNNGTAEVSASNGATPYTYTWTPTNQHTNSITGLAPGIYTVNVAESNGCTKSGTVQVLQGSVLSTTMVSQNETCLGANDGSVSVLVPGSSSAYSYTWTPGSAHTQSVSSLSPGVYSVQVVGAAGCTATNTVIVGQGISLSTSVTSQSISCFGANDGVASVTVTVAGNYTYTWSPGGASTASVSGLPAGIYTVQTASSTGCLGTNTVAIIEGPQMTFSINSQSTTCFGVNDGMAQITVTGGGTAPFSYTWMPSGGNLFSATGLTAGVYTVISKSANNCIVSSTVLVNQGPSMALTVSSQSISCLGANDGVAQVSVSGVPGPYSYTWSPTGANTPSITNLSAGIYTLQASNFSGCTTSSTVQVVQGAPLSVAVLQQGISCMGANDGAAQVFVSGGAGPYSFTWTPMAASTVSVSGLSPGNYTVQTVSVNGCAGSKTFSVTDGQPINLTVTSIKPSCFGASDGSANVFINGGTAPYTYIWNPVTSSTSTIAGLSAGSYTVQAQSQNGCAGSTVFSIGQPLPLSNSAITQSVSCIGGAAGKAEVLVSGGTAPYSYTWVPSGVNSPSLAITQAGTYTCMVSDVNHCSTIATVTIVNAPSPTLSVGSTTICPETEATLNASGASSYTWLPGNSYGSQINVSPLTSVTYTVIGENNYGCTDTVMASVFVSSYPLVFAGNDTIVNMDEPVTLVGSGSDFYGWVPMSGGAPLSCNLCHTITENPQQSTCYVLEAYNEFSCRNSDTVCVTVTEDWNIYIPNAFSPNNNAINDVFIPVGYGIEKIELMIFDRWGSMIFRSDDKIIGWNGTYKNIMCKPDVYIYKVNITTMSRREEYRTGHVVLLK